MKFRILIPFLMMCAVANAQYRPVTPLNNGGAKTAEATEADEAKKGFDPQRLIFGGNLGASFGNYTFVNVSPQVGYMFNNYITAGAGVNFVHQSVKNYVAGTNDYAYKEKYSYAGLNLFARVFPVRFLFISAQPELNYSWGKIQFNNSYSEQADIKQDGKFIPSFLVGAGAVLSPGGKGGLLVSLRYDVIQNNRSPYGTRPYLNIGFGF